MVVGDIGDFAINLIAAFAFSVSARVVFGTNFEISKVCSFLIVSGVLFTGWTTAFFGFFAVLGTVVLKLHSSVVLNTKSDDVTA